MKHLARTCLALTPLLCACGSYEFEGLAMESPVEAIIVGDTVTLNIVRRSESTPVPRAVIWATTDSSIATIDEAGVVTGIGPGVAIIEARTLDYTLRGALPVWETAGPFVSIDAGLSHTCGLDEDGIAWCWGANHYGQLGTAFPPDRCFFAGDAFLPCAMGAIPVETGERFTDLAVGDYHACGLSGAGTPHCWGLNSRGELGDGSTELRPAPAPVLGEHVFASLAAGGGTTCGITVDEALLCWGGAHFGADGPSGGSVPTPTPVAPGTRFAVVATSGGHTCATTVGGTTRCWGADSQGQLGVDGTPAPSFAHVTLGGGFSCGLTAAGVGHCWGGNELGQLGDGTRTGRPEAMPVAGAHTFIDLEAGPDRACGVEASGLLLCWGRGRPGFGNGDRRTESDVPVPSADGVTFTSVTVGSDVQCGVDDAGVTWCWGGNLFGGLGNGRTDRIAVAEPTRVIRHPAR